MMYNKQFVAVIKCNGSILRERSGGSVYLPFGSEYSILLKNKHSYNALVSVEIDGEDVLKGHQLIVGPNKSEELKGWMRSMKKTNKFKFLKKTKQIQQHRGDRIDDGLVRISYQFEKPPEPVTWITSNHEYINYGNTKRGSCAKATWTGDSSYSSGDTVNCYSLSASSSLPLSDEGVTGKGAKINQGYTYGSVGELERETHTIVLQLKGITKRKKTVKKPITVKTKRKCDMCGKRSFSAAKFCSRCGNYLD